MISVVKILSSEIDNLTRRVVKVLRLGREELQTPVQIAPSGIDSSPVKDTIAIHAESMIKGNEVLIGCVNTSQQALPGEIKIYATDSQGDETIAFYLKNDGVAEIGGNQNHLTRFEELKSGFDQLKQDHNNLLQLFNNHIHISAVAGVPNAPTLTKGTSSTASVDAAKIDELKTS